MTDAPDVILSNPRTGLLYPESIPDSSVEAVTADLDMRDPSAVTIAVAGDSTTTPFATGPVESAFKELAAEVWPDRPFQVLRWSKDGDAYPASPTVWQTAAQPSSPGGDRQNVLVGSDAFAGSAVEMAGRGPDVGSGAWTATAGAYIANGGEMVSNPGYTGGALALALFPVITRANKDFAVAGQWRISTTESVSKQRRIVFANSGLSNSSEIRIYLTGSTGGTLTLAKVINTTVTTLATFPAGTIPSSTAAAWYTVAVSLAGTALSATVNGATVTATLTTDEVAALGSNFGIYDNTLNAGLRNYTVRGTVTDPPVAGAPSPLGYATLYNAAVAGSRIDWQTARIAAMYPVQPDLLIVNHGHNYDDTVTGAQFIAALEVFIAALFDKWEPCPVVVWSQNPEFAPRTAAQIAGHRSRQVALRNAARRKGWGYVPIMEAFAGTADGGVSLVQGADGVHPITGPGTNVQKAAVKAYFREKSLRPAS